MKMEQNFEDFYYLIQKMMIKVIQTLLTNRVFFFKKNKKKGEANNLASPKNGFVLGDDASRADCLLSLH